MPTHRSLNKLEYKAHMSIHNTIDVLAAEEGGVDTSSYTRDRFGKKHDLSDGDNRLRLVGRHVFLGSALVLALFSGVAAQADTSALGAIQKKGPNVQVSSSDPEVRSVDSWMNKDDKPVIYQDGSSTVGFNEDGDPSMSTRF